MQDIINRVSKRGRDQLLRDAKARASSIDEIGVSHHAATPQPRLYPARRNSLHHVQIRFALDIPKFTSLDQTPYRTPPRHSDIDHYTHQQEKEGDPKMLHRNIVRGGIDSCKETSIPGFIVARQACCWSRPKVICEFLAQDKVRSILSITANPASVPKLHNIRDSTACDFNSKSVSATISQIVHNRM